MPDLVHKVNRGVRVGLFIYKAFSLSAVFPSLAFGSLPSFRKEADLAGMFFVPASLFTGEKGDRFIITTFSGGWEGGQEKFQPARQCLFFLSRSTPCDKQLRCHSEPSPVPSLSLCRLALAGGGTVKFQHLLHIPPNYYALLLRLSSLSRCLACFPSLPGGARQRPPRRTAGRGITGA